jgi:hypothetical protein
MLIGGYMGETSAGEPTVPYALGLANESYSWYRTAAIRSRRYHRVSAVTLQLLAAAIPASAAVSPQSAIVPAILGAAIVVVSGVRTTFNWHENYIRFSSARESVEAERRRYLTGATPYDDDATRDRVLAARITTVEQDEMTSWVKIARPPHDSQNEQDSLPRSLSRHDPPSLTNDSDGT